MPGRELWRIDTGASTSSRLCFSLRHIVVSEIQGRFTAWGGEVTFDPDQIDRSRIDLWIDVASIDTGSPERDAHLRSPEFLDVARFPRAEFTSSGVVVERDGAARLSGRLWLHGVSRDVDLDMRPERTWITTDGRLRAVYLVSGRIDRQAFGLRWNQDLDVGGVVVGDTVDLEARVELVRADPAIELGWSAPTRRLDAGTACASIHAQHERIRSLLDRARAVAEAALDDQAPSPDAVASAIGDIRTTMEVHLAFEEKALLPILRDDPPLGPERADRLLDEHTRQRATLATLHREACAFPRFPILAAKLAFLTEWLLLDMNEEERSLLIPEVVRDDVVIVDQSSG